MKANIHPQVLRDFPSSTPRCVRCDVLKAQLTVVQAKLAVLQAELGHSKADGVALRAELGRSTAANMDAQARIAELERSAKLNSENSSKPPSTDGLAKPERQSRTSSQRDHREKNPSGGQPGHVGATLRQVDKPDVTVNHFPRRCDGCGAELEQSSADGYVARQVFDLPKPAPLEVTEHRAHVCRCGCGRLTRAEFPRDVGAPAQYGEGIRGYAVYLNVEQLIPEDRIAQIFSDLFGIQISAATVADAVRRKAGSLSWFMENVVLEEALAAPVKNMDETGLKVNKALHWLHVVCTPTLTHYRIGGRGDMLSSVSGIIVHDFYKSYYGMDGVEHALCGGHMLRELQALVDIEKEPWSGRMQSLLCRACHAVNLINRKLDGMVATDSMTEADKSALEQARAKVMLRLASIAALVERRYAAIVAEAIAFHEALPAFGKPKLRMDGTPSKRAVAKRIGHNLAVRLRDYRTDVLRFVHDLSVPFTNNAAEQAIRMTKVKMKISGCFRALAGAERFATVRGFTDTARKRGWNILSALSLRTDALIEQFSSA